MEETLMRVLCLGCQRRRFDVRATQVGDETVELCPKCRRGQRGAAETVATLVPGVDGSLGFDEVPMKGEGSASLIFVVEPVASKCCKRMVKLLINRFGRTRCIPCDAELMVQRAGHRMMALAPVMMLALLFLSGCGAPAEVACLGPRAYTCESDCVTFCQSSAADDGGVFVISRNGCEPSCWNRPDGGAR